MKKNSDFKNISYSNFEFISLFIIMMFSTYISNNVNQILRDCEGASFIGTIFISCIVYLIYTFITKKIFQNEYDFYEVIKKTYPLALQKIIGVLLYVFTIAIIYIMIYNITFILKTTTYTLSTTNNLIFYFIIAMLLVSLKGFNSIFRIAGYVSIPILVYILLLFLFSLPYASFTNFFPILGTGILKVFGTNVENIAIYTPLFFTLMFGGTIHHEISRDNVKNFKRIFLYTFLALLLIITMFIGTMPADLLNTRFTLLFDLSRIVSFSTISIRIAPIMIFVFSFIIFLSSSFVLLIGCFSLERLHVIKDYSKVLIATIIVISISLLLPNSLTYFHKTQVLFNYICIGIAFVFPLLTIILYAIKRFMKHDTSQQMKLEKVENPTNEVTSYE